MNSQTIFLLFSPLWLQGMIDKLIETGRYYDMEMNVEKTKVMRISKQPSQ